MHVGGSRSASTYDRLLDWFISNLDSVRSRATLLIAAVLAITSAGFKLTTGFGEVALWRFLFWTLVVVGNLLTVYILTTYRKPPGTIEREVLRG